MAEAPIAPTCAKCGEHPAGPGRILCTDCLTRLTANAEDFWRDHPQGGAHPSGQRLDPAEPTRPNLAMPSAAGELQELPDSAAH